MGTQHAAEAILDFETPEAIARIPRAAVLLKKCGLDKTLWGKRIIEAEQQGGFEEDVAEEAAHFWTTCACGTLDPRIPRIRHSEHGGFAPADLRIAQLGSLFGDVVDNAPLEGLSMVGDPGQFASRARKLFGFGDDGMEEIYVDDGCFIAAAWLLAHIEIEAVRILREQGLSDRNIFEGDDGTVFNGQIKDRLEYVNFAEDHQ